MIKCKEDLYGTHVFYRDTEAMKEYIRLIRVLGIGDVSDNQPSERECVVEVHKCDWASYGYDASMTDIAGIDDGSKRLTLSDFKPTRTEYEKVTESIFDLRDEFERGELYGKIGNTYESISSTQCLSNSLAVGMCYRKVEKEIDERQEFVDLAIDKIDPFNCDDPSYYSGWFEQLYDAGCRFVGANEEIE